MLINEWSVIRLFKIIMIHDIHQFHEFKFLMDFKEKSKLIAIKEEMFKSD